MDLKLTPLTEENYIFAQAIDRSDVPEAFLDTAETIMAYTRYAWEHNCRGRTFTVWLEGQCVGMILLGEAFAWESDPPEMAAEPFYRLMGFVIDRRFRGRGLGTKVLELAVEAVYREFCPRPIALGVHRDNPAAARFYERHGFRGVDAWDGEDQYYLRWPVSTASKPSPEGEGVPERGG